MQPFPVICETCHARLKVRSDSVIGQILACPKCGSMVEIVPPADWLPDDVTPPPEPVAEPQAALAPWLGLPIALWASGAAVLLVAATTAGLLLSHGNAESRPPVDAPVPAVEATTVALEVSTQHSATEASPAPAAPKAEPIDTAPSDRSPAKVDESNIEATIEAITSSPATSSPAVETPAPAAQPAPPVSEAENLTLVKQQESTSAKPPTDDHGAEAIASEPHSKSPVFNPRSSLIDPQAVVRLGPISSESQRAPDVAAQLALPIQSLKLSRVPLADLIEMLSDMAAVPITLEPAALRMAGVGANDLEMVDARNTTVAELLDGVLATRGLAYEEQSGRLTIVKPNVDRERSVDYEVKDLIVPGAAGAAQVADLVRRFVAPDTWKTAGGTGRIDVDGSTLHVTQTERVHYQILTFCERLRLARDLPPRSRYPVDRLSIDPIYPQLEARLAQPTTFTFLPWARLADVFRNWQDTAGVTVLVDWNALAEHELSPTTPVACSIVDRPWNESLSTILRPLGLTWWVVDDQTIQITSLAAASQLTQVEFYPVAKSTLDQHVSTAALTAALERRLAGQSTSAAGAPYRIVFDAPSQRAIVFGPPDVQRVVASWLNALEPQSHEGLSKRKPIFPGDGPQ